ncbi:hypothetical protein K438DRAFT_1832335 [Mycena galopus ATCC 62051]|nr:hypothetical protein K438DRAFT_1832335 [Mycena galopus ATCC 62051]
MCTTLSSPHSFAPKPPIHGILGSWQNKLEMLSRSKVVQTKDCGEDFFFHVDMCMKNKSGWTQHIHDFITGGFFSQALIASAGEPEVDPILDYVDKGSSTVCIITLNSANGLLKAANLGDSGFSILRGGSVLYSQPVQTHFFNCPKQLTKLPPPSGKRFTSETYQTQLCNRDIIVACTDGLTDNVFPHEMVEICSPDPDTGNSDDAQAQSWRTIWSYTPGPQECMAAKSRISPFERQAAQEGMFFPGGILVVALVHETEA